MASETATRPEPAGRQERTFRHCRPLDGLRGAAVLFVLLRHFGALWHERFSGGLIGVDVFFVLSGFLITSLLVGEHVRRGKVSFVKFYVRRALRLAPALVLYLVGYVIYIETTGGSLRHELRPILSVVFYVANFVQAYWRPDMVSGPLAVTWSLSIEEQFYLVWPALLLFGIFRFAKSRRATLAVIGAGALVALALRIFLYRHSGFYVAYVSTEGRADSLLIGAAAALLWRWRMVPTRYLNQMAWVSAAGLVFVVIAGKDSWSFMYYGGFTLVALGTAVIILAVAEAEWSGQRLIDWAPLRALGRVSYGVYLYHWLVLAFVLHWFKGPQRLKQTLVGLALTAVVAIASWYFVEQPFIRVKDRIARPD